VNSSRGCPAVCCGKLLAIVALLLVPVAAVVAVSPWTLPADGQVSIAAEDAAGLNVVEPAPQERLAPVAAGDNTQVERQARDWTFTDGPRPSSNR
jgi:hypothetical protein